METILEELNEGVVVLDQLRVIFANEALARMGHFERDEIQGRTPDAIFPAKTFSLYQPISTGNTNRATVHPTANEGRDPKVLGLP
jgi:PAS domain-containing protein